MDNIFFFTMLSVAFAVGVIPLLYMLILFLVTRVPHVRTPEKRFDLIFSTLQELYGEDFSNAHMVDLGSGYGSVLLEAEKRGFGTQTGYELSPHHAWVSQLLVATRRSEVQIQRKNFFDADLRSADVVYLFLNAPAVQKLSKKVLLEPEGKTTVVVLGDQLEGAEPIVVHDTDDGSGVQIYFYQFGK